ncbi:MAG: helix-turn-helix transcriptional regulator [Clostridia bacterium]|nr:helix-turn-helix transcriptional regulator [Clostridia bacterium]
MTIGETIQYHRKRLGLSQEDLGQKLNLSRQTVSLWENDQTQPTVDNFLRLKEIFGVSVDTLLGFEGTPRTEPEVPVVGTYRFQYTQADIDYLFRQFVIDYIKDPLLYLFLFVESLLFTSDILGYGEINLFAFSLVGSLSFIYIFRRVAQIKQYKDSLPKYLTTEYDFIFYADDTLLVNVYKNQYLHMTVRTPLEKISDITFSDNYIHLQIGTNYFIATKSVLPLCDLAAKYPEKTQYRHKATVWSVGAWILFFASLIAALAGLEAVAIYTRSSDLSFANHWIFAVIALFPLVSVVYGIVLKRKKIYKYKKNIAAGCFAVLTILLCVAFTIAYYNMFI